MIRIEIQPVWRFRRDDDPRSMLVMLDFLNEIRATGKLTRAAARAHVSYRHAWNLIEKWSAFFAMPLVVREQGRGTRLTPFGDKLVWAGQRLQARLGPQLQNLCQELETQINQLLPTDRQLSACTRVTGLRSRNCGNCSAASRTSAWTSGTSETRIRSCPLRMTVRSGGHASATG